MTEYSVKLGCVDRFWGGRPFSVFFIAAVLAPISVLLTMFLSYLLNGVFEFSGISPNSVEEVVAAGLGPTRIISAVVVAPIVENVLCLIWARLMAKLNIGPWWVKPLLIALIAAAFHALIFMDIRPIAVLPGFFVISALIVNVKNSKLGYWSSVAHHSLINVINVGLVMAS